MSRRVPSWDLQANPAATSKMSISSTSLPNSVDYEVAELTYANGQIALHGLGPSRVQANKTTTPPSGTLESIVNQATSNSHTNGGDCAENLLIDPVPWYDQDHQHRTAAEPITSASLPMTMDALVPCTAATDNQGSCNPVGVGRVARADMGIRKGNNNNMVSLSVSESATCGGRDSRQLTLDTCDRELGGAGFTSTSLGSPGNTISGREYTVDDHHSVCHSRQRKEGDDDGKRKGITGKSSISTKRSRAAAVHNQSERKRRDKINERMKTLQKMVPNSSKTDKASMLDEVIDYLRQLQAQVQMMSRVNISPAMQMMSMAMQPQLQQMAMMQMAGMGMAGMGMGVNVMDINAAMNRAATAGVGVSPPNPFMPMVSWDNSGERLPPAPPSVMPDPLSVFLASQSQPMNVDAYSKMAALYQQLQQNPVPGSKN